ncbi:MAG: hypothetical protein HC892_01155 [Saprospiraceae bacterium]|nr:hypothetical protein [Saprospiraceae bacterium]
MRKALLRGNPVLVEMQVDAGFDVLSGVEFWESNGDSQDRITPLIVVSYDEELEAFELQNSLGNLWGNKGYIWMKYADFEQFAINGFVLLPD